MLHLTLQTLLDLSKYTQKQNNWPNEVVENQKYEGHYPMVTYVTHLQRKEEKKSTAFWNTLYLTTGAFT